MNALVKGEKECSICSSKKTRFTVPFNGWNIFRCDTCGFRFAEDGDPLKLDDHYDEEYFKPLMQRDTTDKWASIYSNRLALLKENAPNQQLLETGAGASTFAIDAVEFGFNVTVVDGAPWAVNHLASHEGITGAVADLNAGEFPIDTFGAIHCSHTLEHLSSPKRFLQGCLNALTPGGVLYLTFPVYEARMLFLKDSLYKIGVANHPYNYQAPDHVSYFSANCILKALQVLGYEITSSRRLKFMSLRDYLGRHGNGSTVRKVAVAAAKPFGLITGQLGFHRDIEIVARRPTGSV
tara:strand:- start:9161 stop:10042 length:882 start_codon:yes stop_codon:yes gene_type:complete